jgi:hypothetical protein
MGRSWNTIAAVLALFLACASARGEDAAPGTPGDENASLKTWLEPDDGPEEGIHLDRLLATGATGAAVLTGYLVYGYTKWWEDEREPFHISQEGNLERDSYVGGVDKFGHAWACHVFTRGTSALLQWSGVPRPWAVLAGTALVQAVFTFAELEDSYYDYGWSDGDILFNLLGSALAAALDFLPWLDDLVDFRLWYLPTPYLYRRNFNAAEDFSGQKYFLVFKGGGLPWLKDTGFAYLELYVGYHAPGYRRHREVKERRIFFGFSLDVGRVLHDFFFPAVRPPRFVESATAFVFEHWHPHVWHAPLADAKLP